MPPINLPGDLCDEGGPDVDCGTEAEEKYRRIDGRCNNLNDGRELWGSAG